MRDDMQNTERMKRNHDHAITTINIQHNNSKLLQTMHELNHLRKISMWRNKKTQKTQCDISTWVQYNNKIFHYKTHAAPKWTKSMPSARTFHPCECALTHRHHCTAIGPSVTVFVQHQSRCVSGWSS